MSDVFFLIVTPSTTLLIRLLNSKKTRIFKNALYSLLTAIRRGQVIVLWTRVFQDFCEFQNILYTLKLQGLATPSQDLRKKRKEKKDINVVMNHYLSCNKCATSTFSLQKSVLLDLASRALIKFLDFFFNGPSRAFIGERALISVDIVAQTVNQNIILSLY